jgi:hypothetical protein
VLEGDEKSARAKTDLKLVNSLPESFVAYRTSSVAGKVMRGWPKQRHNLRTVNSLDKTFVAYSTSDVASSPSHIQLYFRWASPAHFPNLTAHLPTTNSFPPGIHPQTLDLSSLKFCCTSHAPNAGIGTKVLLLLPSDLNCEFYTVTFACFYPSSNYGPSQVATNQLFD